MVKVRSRFFSEEKGAIFAEALVVVPVITIFAMGVIEFGNIFWQRLQLETGVRDAARYWARCKPSFHTDCTIAKARNIGFYGIPVGTTSPGRVPGWDDAAELTITPAVPPLVPTDTDIVTAAGSVVYDSSPLYGFLGIPPITLEYTHQQRYIGW